MSTGYGGSVCVSPSETTDCDAVLCGENEHCEMVQVQCVRAPCNPIAECRQDP